jgi:hypothetical protein
LALAEQMNPPERRAARAEALKRALDLPEDNFFNSAIYDLAKCAADLDRRGLAVLSSRTLRHWARYSRQLLWGGWTTPVLDALGGAPALLDAARAYVEIGQWFP